MSTRILVAFIALVAVGVAAYEHGSMPGWVASHGVFLAMHSWWIIWKAIAVVLSLTGTLVLRLRRCGGARSGN